MRQHLDGYTAPRLRARVIRNRHQVQADQGDRVSEDAQVHAADGVVAMGLRNVCETEHGLQAADALVRSLS
jgi:hypothetical protein